MQLHEGVISKQIVTPDGEKDFQLRYFHDENVGIICTPTDKTYFLLDSADYWYDLIQEKYPPAAKCSCKNDRFNITLDYIPRADTDDFREICINYTCTVCHKTKRFPPVKIDYSPSSQLYDCPVTFCKQPKIKYKTYSMKGYWSDDELIGLAKYLLGRGLFVYCWFWDPQNAKKQFKALSEAELYDFLTANEQKALDITELHTLLTSTCDKKKYLAIYFSEEPLNGIPKTMAPDGTGIHIQDDIWRKNCIIMLHGPFMVMSHGLFYQMDFCSEYLDKDGNVVSKPASFCALIKEFHKFGKKLLKKC